LIFVPSSETANPHLDREGRTQSPALEKASRTGHPKFTTLIQSGCTGVEQDPVVKKILRNAEGRATRRNDRVVTIILLAA
jgi:hypothetical protein